MVRFGLGSLIELGIVVVVLEVDVVLEIKLRLLENPLFRRESEGFACVEESFSCKVALHPYYPLPLVQWVPANVREDEIRPLLGSMR